jgi:aminoglycoside 3-N-acetyltransferase
MKIAGFKSNLRNLVGDSEKPVLVYSGIFSLMSAIEGISVEALPSFICESLMEVVGKNRDLLMPTFTNGFRNGFINLDTEPCSTGMVNEVLRQNPESRRTKSAWFSFTVQGPDAGFLSERHFGHAWGNNSILEWIEQNEAVILVIGVPWPMVSFFHRAEWLCQVPYRYDKSFEGTIHVRGRDHKIKETLFVRGLDPVVDNQWAGINEYLAEIGMRSIPLGRSHMAQVLAKPAMEKLSQVIAKNAFAFVKDAEKIRAAYGTKSSPRL